MPTIRSIASGIRLDLVRNPATKSAPPIRLFSAPREREGDCVCYALYEYAFCLLASLAFRLRRGRPGCDGVAFRLSLPVACTPNVAELMRLGFAWFEVWKVFLARL